ncbi:glycosyltransferase [Naasia lichenicola]|uniref:Glycosyltransferase subfamily 4-like N-terminal domain-containing protein n=1 Tax=Naasia lichenicola TaxID=2565933 RepID=A0A4S4FI32_9MICO|nr:glycosyltransferase [Naasia lichenicola]THG29909.1 hypothetical protein E6C64_14780 [Naasia lichenicola]
MRIASIPAGHPYVQGSLRGLDVLPDPTPPGAGPGQWWPPVMWDADWVRANAHAFDVMHVHFGMESFAPAHMRGVLDALAEVGRPFVLTVHDLQNPQLVDQTVHLAQLDLLIGAADAVVTLTAGAAAEIAARWGRNAVVIPHPRMLERADRFAALAPTGRPRIGIHLKDLRPGVDGPGTVAAAAEALRLRADGAGDGAVLEVHLHERVRDHEAERQVRALADADPAIELQVHSRLDDDALAASIARLSAAILPYRHGTHSGWLELCWDLGVPVLAPAIGHLIDQHADGVFAFDTGSQSSTARSMARAIDQAVTAAPERAGSIRRRSAQRDLQQPRITEAHGRLYRAVTGARGEGAHVSGTAGARSTPARTPR